MANFTVPCLFTAFSRTFLSLCPLIEMLIMCKKKIQSSISLYDVLSKIVVAHFPSLVNR